MSVPSSKSSFSDFNGGHMDAYCIRAIKIKTVSGSGVILISGLTQGRNTGFIEAA